jgi:ferredoxin
MARVYVITDRCIKDMFCVEVCMREAIHPDGDEPGFSSAGQLYINPKRCIGCGTCVEACRNGAIVGLEDSPARFSQFAQVNAAWFGA